MDTDGAYRISAADRGSSAESSLSAPSSSSAASSNAAPILGAGKTRIGHHLRSGGRRDVVAATHASVDHLIMLGGLGHWMRRGEAAEPRLHRGVLVVL